MLSICISSLTIINMDKEVGPSTACNSIDYLLILQVEYIYMIFLKEMMF